MACRVLLALIVFCIVGCTRSGPVPERPPTYWRHAAAFDPDRDRLVVFGGVWFEGTLEVGDRGENHYVGETWEWNGESWAQVATTGPSARADSTMVYHASRRVMLLFGGIGPPSEQCAEGDELAICPDTWSWDGSSWTLLTVEGPGPRSGHAMVYDEARDRTVLFGGIDASLDLAGDSVWEWDGAAWNERPREEP